MTAEDPKFRSPSPAVMDQKKGRGRGLPVNPDGSVRYPDPDRFLQRAKALVVSSWNAKKPMSDSPLKPDQLYIISFTKMLEVWKAVIISPVLRGKLWIVTSNAEVGEAYIQVFDQTDNIKMKDGMR